MTTHPLFIRDAEARRRHAQTPPPPEHPLPIVAGRTAEPSEVNGGARDLGNWLASQGFRLRYVYAEGYRVHAKTGKPLKGLTRSISVRATRTEGDQPMTLTVQAGQSASVTVPAMPETREVRGLWFSNAGKPWEIQGVWTWIQGRELPKSLLIDDLKALLDPAA